MCQLKKKLSVLFSTMLVFMLAACNQTATTVNESSKTEENKKENTSELTLEQVMTNSMEASEEMKSFAVQMDMTQEMTVPGQTEVINMESVIDMKVVTEPMTLYQKMDMKMNDIGAEDALSTESYISADGIYILDPAANQWMKFPKEMSDQLIQLSNQQTNPAEEIKKLQQFVDDFTFEQDEQNYILKLNASGDKFTDFIKETVKETFPQELSAGEDMFNNMKINKVTYEILIDKETYYPTSLNVLMDMEITAEGETLKIKQNMKGQYSDFNTIEEVKVPQEVIDNAVEMDM
ncbi:hypothetical protein MVE64_11895 [Metabacillus endolithicus]|nr:DUF6612 family protein [Metabacillus endolithicus]UPG65605.1 hypothetical protein MVE64_11895 [Metabacillus endolithicus]